MSSMDDYDYDEELGHGAFGEVYIAYKKSDPRRRLCLKVQDKETIKMKGAAKYLKTELSILKEVKHKNIIELVDSFEDEERSYQVFELCNGGSLQDCLNDYKETHNQSAFPEELVQYFMRQVIEGMCYLHNKRILHRDLKLENIMLNYPDIEDKKKKNYMKAEVKLIDFGFARHLKIGEWATSSVGTLPYKEPKLLNSALKNKSLRNSTMFAYDEKIDIWSLGILCYELLVGSWAFDASSEQEMIDKVQKGEFKFPASLSKETLMFVSDMLKYDYELRPSANDLAKYPFLTKNVKDFTHINLDKAKGKISGGKMRLNAKYLTSVFNTVFDEEELAPSNPKNLGDIEEENNEIDLEDVKKEFAEDFMLLNKYYIPIKYTIYPVVPGTSPDLFKSVL